MNNFAIASSQEVRLRSPAAYTKSHLINGALVLAKLSSGAKAHILYPFYVGAESPTS